MPPVLAVAWGTAGTVAARPAQAAQAVVPSAICAPHTLQNAIEVSASIVVEREGCKAAARARPPPSNAAAKYQKARGKAINNFGGRKKPRAPRPAVRQNRPASAV